MDRLVRGMIPDLDAVDARGAFPRRVLVLVSGDEKVGADIAGGEEVGGVEGFLPHQPHTGRVSDVLAGEQRPDALVARLDANRPGFLLAHGCSIR